MEVAKMTLDEIERLRNNLDAREVEIAKDGDEYERQRREASRQKLPLHVYFAPKTKEALKALREYVNADHIEKDLFDGESTGRGYFRLDVRTQELSWHPCNGTRLCSPIGNIDVW